MPWELYFALKKINYMLEINILRNSSQSILGVLKVDFWGFWCINDTQTSCCLRLCNHIACLPQYFSDYSHNILNEIKHIHIQCHGNYIELKKINYKLEINILRNSSQNILGVLKVYFWGFWCINDTQTSCCLRLCSHCLLAFPESPASLWGSRGEVLPLPRRDCLPQPWHQ